MRTASGYSLLPISDRHVAIKEMADVLTEDASDAIMLRDWLKNAKVAVPFNPNGPPVILGYKNDVVHTLDLVNQRSMSAAEKLRHDEALRDDTDQSNYARLASLINTAIYTRFVAYGLLLASTGLAILGYLRRGANPSLSIAELEEGTDADIGAHTEPSKAVPIIFKAIKGRFRREIEDLGRRGNVNLSVGVVVTIAAIAVLVYLTQGDHAFRTTPDALQFYLPRITTVVLIETFSYFFLGLYRGNLSEIKYYQNERTTIEAMEIAWRSAASNMPKDSDEIDVIHQLVRTDRNAGVKLSVDGTQNDALEIVKTLSKVVADSVKKGGKD